MDFWLENNRDRLNFHIFETSLRQDSKTVFIVLVLLSTIKYRQIFDVSAFVFLDLAINEDYEPVPIEIPIQL